MEQYEYERLVRAQRVDNFTRLVNEAEEGNAFTITKEGEPVAVVIGYDEFLRLRSMTAAMQQIADSVPDLMAKVESERRSKVRWWLCNAVTGAAVTGVVLGFMFGSTAAVNYSLGLVVGSALTLRGYRWRP